MKPCFRKINWQQYLRNTGGEGMELIGQLRGYYYDPDVRKRMPEPVTEKMENKFLQCVLVSTLVFSLDSVTGPEKLPAPFRAYKTVDSNLKPRASMEIIRGFFQRKKLCSVALPRTCRLRSWQKNFRNAGRAGLFLHKGTMFQASFFWFTRSES